MKASQSSVGTATTHTASTAPSRADLSRLLIRARVQDVAALEQQVAEMSRYLLKLTVAQERLEAMIAEEMESARMFASTLPREKAAGSDEEDAMSFSVLLEACCLALQEE
ncbi:hypothetical protein BBJ28_00025945 [Nothophytophthora sp. Chile5]|nr:hypothetical protein BBJ28_00025945 [Nothophytophthora sp. Chile5]